MRTSLKYLIRIIATSSSQETIEEITSILPPTMSELIIELLAKRESPEPRQYLDSDDFSRSPRPPRPQETVDWSTDDSNVNDNDFKKKNKRSLSSPR